MCGDRVGHRVNLKKASFEPLLHQASGPVVPVSFGQAFALRFADAALRFAVTSRGCSVPASCRLAAFERLAVPVVDHLGSGPTDLRAVLGTASLFGAHTSVHVLVGEAGQAQIESVAVAWRVLAHFFVGMTAVRTVAVGIDVADRAGTCLEMLRSRFRAVGH
jgi:hypothetical protein